MPKMNENLLRQLMERGVRWAQKISNTLAASPEMQDQPANLLAIGGLLYSAGLARESGLNLEAWVMLAVHAFNNVEVTGIGDEPKKGS